MHRKHFREKGTRCYKLNSHATMNVMNVKWAQMGDFIEATVTFSPTFTVFTGFYYKNTPLA